MYREEISELYDKTVEKLVEWGIQEDSINWKSEYKKRRRPGGVYSQFLANRELGDWAEKLLLDELNTTLVDYITIKYGNSDNIIAGDDDFPEFYNDYQNELASTGKRPDLLIFKKDSYDISKGLNISSLDLENLKTITPKALLGVEVRSSKVYALEYAKIREVEAQNNPKFKGRMVLSFTPKVEDLPLVMRWINTYNVPHYYFQVCLDAVFGISFKDILNHIINSKENLIERNSNNQNKSTIHIPMTSGSIIGNFTKDPEYKAVVKKNKLARVDAYVVFYGGKIELNEEILHKIVHNDGIKEDKPFSITDPNSSKLKKNLSTFLN